MKRKILRIDEERCNGCGKCITTCAEGAIELVNGKARLISESYCDGLGACIGNCPQDALIIEEREAPAFDEEAVNIHLKKMGGKSVGTSHQGHQHNFHGATGCPSSRVIQREVPTREFERSEGYDSQSMLSQWPIQLTLVPPNAPFLEDADLLLAADCAPFAYARFHQDFLKEKALLIACPKLDDVDFYIERLTEIFSESKIKSITIVHMEVPCCFGLNHMVEEALAASKKKIPVEEVTIGIDGEIKRG